MGEAAGDRRSAERHGGGNMVLSSASWRRWMIVDGRGDAEVWFRKFHHVHLRESQKSREVKCLQGSTFSRCRRRVHESSLCSSACPCEEKLQLKLVTVEVCTVFRELCPCPCGASWLRPAWVR
jgi:hypothetical protein